MNSTCPVYFLPFNGLNRFEVWLHICWKSKCTDDSFSDASQNNLDELFMLMHFLDAGKVSMRNAL